MERLRRLAEETSTADEVAGPGPSPAALGWQALQQAGNRAVGGLIQRMAFPHRSAITTSTGESLPGSAVLDPSSCADRGVPAWTDGLVTHFAGAAPTVHVAAHEAAHQLQHGGRTRDQGLGPEGHARGVADAAAEGRSARDLIGASGAVVPSAARGYTDIPEATQSASGEWKAGKDARVGDQGRTITIEDDPHLAYADPALIKEANAILQAKKSGVRIEPGTAGPSGHAPDGSGVKSTVKVDYKILSDKDNEDFYADCGVSSREVQGPMGTDTSPRGVYTDAAGNRQETAPSKNPANFRDEIYVQGGLGPDPASAHAAYNALSAADKDAFDRKHGINRYAAPGVGEAFTRRRDDEAGGTGFNFHWGGVIMVAGGDRVTFENYTKGHGYDAKDDEWYFATYGPPTKAGQTWHEQWASVGGPGKGTTLAAATTPDPSAFIGGAAAMSTADLIKKIKAAPPQAEKMALEGELDNRWIKVTVVVKKAQEGPDDVYVVAAHGARKHKTGEAELGTGDKNTFWIPVSKLAPITGKIMVEVYDHDTLSADDMISIVGFDDPYTPAVDNRPWDDAVYNTTVEFDR
jgi:hypothetical protein